MPLIQSNDLQKAKTLCEGWLKSADRGTRAEGHKCLANVELGMATGPKVQIQGTKERGGFIGPYFEEAAARRAVAHLDEALQLAPQDLSIHQGRLHILMTAGLFADMAKALDQSIQVYKGLDPVSAWIAYPAELYETRRYEQAIELLLHLDKRYPGDHRMAGNLSACFAMLKRDDEALEWANKSVSLAPEDPIDNWNLARVYD
jgi:tetratricopeptide (TPR) repeat protein